MTGRASECKDPEWITASWNILSLHSSSFTAVPSAVSEKWDGVQKDLWGGK